MVGASDGISWWRVAVLAVVAVWLGRYLFAPDAITSSWMHGPVLVIHEAGHILFAPFGRFVAIIGGTYLQVALPLAFALYFFLSGQRFSGAVVLLWVAFALVDGAVYVADAQERALPLITFDRDTHDWWNLLRQVDLLHRDDLLAALLHGQAFAVFAVGLVIGWRAAQPSAPSRPANLR